MNMNEFEKQIEAKEKKFLAEFNDNKFSDIRAIYKKNFSEIKNFISAKGIKISIEDISLLDENLAAKISEENLLLQQINIQINKGKITVDDLL